MNSYKIWWTNEWREGERFTWIFWFLMESNRDSYNSHPSFSEMRMSDEDLSGQNNGWLICGARNEIWNLLMWCRSKNLGPKKNNTRDSILFKTKYGCQISHTHLSTRLVHIHLVENFRLNPLKIVRNRITDLKKKRHKISNLHQCHFGLILMRYNLSIEKKDSYNFFDVNLLRGNTNVYTYVWQQQCDLFCFLCSLSLTKSRWEKWPAKWKHYDAWGGGRVNVVNPSDLDPMWIWYLS